MQLLALSDFDPICPSQRKTIGKDKVLTLESLVPVRSIKEIDAEIARNDGKMLAIIIEAALVSASEQAELQNPVISLKEFDDDLQESHPRKENRRLRKFSCSPAR